MQLRREGFEIGSLLGALSAGEITIGELSDGLEMLTSEAIWVLTASLNTFMVAAERPDRRLVDARSIALKKAATRHLLS